MKKWFIDLFESVFLPRYRGDKLLSQVIEAEIEQALFDIKQLISERKEKQQVERSG